MIEKIKQKCTEYNIEWQFVKFLFVGVLNTVFGYSVYAVCIFFHAHYTLATFIATVLGILFNFKTTGNIVFKNNDNKLIVKFFLVYGFVYLITIGIIKLLTLMNLNNMYVDYAIALPFNVITAYFLMKNFVFK